MLRLRRAASLAAGFVSVLACTKSASTTADTSQPAATVAAAPDPAADQQAMKTVDDSWFKAYNAGDADALTALYTDDAMVSIPGVAVAQGSQAIKEAYKKDIAASAKAGATNTSGANPTIKVAGDMGYIWNTFTVTNKAGKSMGTGKYLTVFTRKDGKWMIAQDIWNMDS